MFQFLLALPVSTSRLSVEAVAEEEA
jgi:hypothetical protein